MDNTASQISNGFLKSSTAPVDWGLRFALAHKFKLFQFVLFPMLVSIVGNYMMWSSRLDSGQRMLIAIGSIIVTVWLWSMSLLYCVSLLQGKSFSFFKLANSAAANVPKVFASYGVCFVLILFGLSTLILPGLVFLAYFLWAPAFCIAESLVPASEKKPSDDEEEDPSIRELSYFKHKSIFELGLVRSWRLAAPRIATSFHIALLMLVCLVVPMAFVELLFPDKVGFAPIAVSVTLTSLSGVIAIGAWAGAFLQLLPVEARKEIELPIDYESAVSNSKPVRFAGRPILHFILFGVTALCGYLVLHGEMKSRDLPNGVTVDVRSIERKDNSLIFQIELYDEQRLFHWIDVDNFRASPSDDVVLSPEKVKAFDQNDNYLDPYYIGPHKGLLKLEIVFSGPQQLPESGDVKLHYMSFGGLRAPNANSNVSDSSPLVYQGRFGDNW